MAEMTTTVDDYFAIGCGRCPLVGTPECKVHDWQDEMSLLRDILLDCGLTETMKWGVPCYMVDDNNVLLLSAFKKYCSLSFFKGALLDDPHGMLYQPSKNSQASRLLRFTAVDDIKGNEAKIKDYVMNAIEVEKAGLEVNYKKTEDYDMPDEFISKFEDDPAFEAAFEALTPGRQRGYLLHFSGAKQSKTRVARIERCVDKIFEGKGHHER